MVRLISFALLVLAAVSASAQNILLNGGFEVSPPPAFANNYPWPVAPWILSSPSLANVVKVDGPGGLSYSNHGPESDASGGAGHYLDIANDQDTFYQAFTPRCTGPVEFGGSFSTRADRAGSARLVIRSGTGTSGTAVSSILTPSLPGGNSQTTPWVTVSSTVTLQALQPYSFVVFMDNSTNFDNGFVRYLTDCEAPDPCCPPWNSYMLEDMLFYNNSNAVGQDYTLRFTPSPSFHNQMQTYINFLNSGNSAISQITIHFRIDDGGNGTNPVQGAKIGNDYFMTWTANGAQPTGTFFNNPPETLHVNHWYIAHTGIYLENGQHYFPDSCANNDVAVRLQLQNLGSPSGPTRVLQFQRAGGEIVEKR